MRLNLKWFHFVTFRAHQKQKSDFGKVKSKKRDFVADQWPAFRRQTREIIIRVMKFQSSFWTRLGTDAELAALKSYLNWRTIRLLQDAIRKVHGASIELMMWFGHRVGYMRQELIKSKPRHVNELIKVEKEIYFMEGKVSKPFRPCTSSYVRAVTADRHRGHVVSKGLLELSVASATSCNKFIRIQNNSSKQGRARRFRSPREVDIMDPFWVVCPASPVIGAVRAFLSKLYRIQQILGKIWKNYPTLSFFVKIEKGNFWNFLAT